MRGNFSSSGPTLVSLPSEFIGSVFSGVESGFVTLARFAPSGGLVCYRFSVADDFSLVDRYVEQYRETLYYNVGISRTNPGENIRGNKASLSAVAMLWADVDLPKAGSDKKYPTLDAIDDALADMPLRYSLKVNTGGGLHIYWLLNEPFLLDSTEACQDFENKFSKPWQNLLKVKLAKYGDFEIDSTFDCTRMLRIPGSWHKNGNQCILEDGDFQRRYDISDFEQFVESVRIETLLPQHKVSIEGDIAGLIDPARLDALLYNSPEFKKVWERKKDYGDASAADAALARHGIQAGWSDSAIMNLMVAFDKKYNLGRSEKLFRKESPQSGYVNYMGRTIAAIRGKMAKDQSLLDFDFEAADAAIAARDEMPVEIEHEAEPDESGVVAVAVEVKPEIKAVDDIKLDAVKRLSQKLEIPIASWIQVGREDPIFTLVLATGQQIEIGGEAAVIDSPRVFNHRIYSVLNKPLVPLTKQDWYTVVRLLGLIVEVIDSPEVKKSATAQAGILQYIEGQPILKENVRDEAIKRMAVWYDNEFLYIYIATVVRYINLHGGGKKWGNGEFVNAIRQLGFINKNLNYTSNDGARSSKSYWMADITPYKEIISGKRH